MKISIALIATTSATLYPTWETTTEGTTTEPTTTTPPLDEAQIHIRRYKIFSCIFKFLVLHFRLAKRVQNLLDTHFAPKYENWAGRLKGNVDRRAERMEAEWLKIREKCTDEPVPEEEDVDEQR